MSVEGLNRTDPSQNFIERYPHPLDAVFHPHVIAVIGAKDDPGTVGRTIMHNLLTPSFRGIVHPVNPKRKQVFGLKAYPSVLDVPTQIDLAIIVTPAQTVPKIITECVKAKVKSVIIISAGFKELGEQGRLLEEEILLEARGGKMPIIGPNCLGVMNPINGLNATFAKGIALPGHIAFISQSGAMCTAVLDWSFQKKVGFSGFVSVGSMVDVNWGTLIDYFGSDSHTHSLLLYMESIGDARSFMTAAREVALQKPIIVIKAGRSQEAAQAAASHTGSLAGSDEVFDAALERIGVLRVNSIGELFHMASVLAKQPLPKGNRLTILTNAGGPGVLATDAIIANHGALTPLSPQTVEKLNHILPPAWSHSNPVDILGDANADRYVESIEVLFEDPESDGLLVILSPQDVTEPTETATKIKKIAQKSKKPILASWMGGATVQEGSGVLTHAQIPVFEYPDDAAKAFAMMWHYHQNLQSLYECPAIDSLFMGKNKNGSVFPEIDCLKKGEKEKRTLLNEFESKKILEAYQIPIVKTVIVYSSEDAVKEAIQMGFPVVLKLFSETITHKTDVGGVKLNLYTAEDVKDAYDAIEKSVSEKVGSDHFGGVTVQKMVKHRGYELILGSSTDPQFGPVILFGMGGELVEVFKDRALAFPPLNRNLVHQLMEKTKIYEALKGVRGKKPINMSALEEVFINFSHLIIENPRIKECDINPLVVFDDQIVALDARILLHDWAIPDDQLPRLAIRPYPYHYIVQTTLKNELAVTLRPILPEDEHLLANFHRELSENSVRQRYFAFMSLDERVAHERLMRICFNDFDREWAIIAIIGEKEKKEMIGIGRLIRIPGLPRAQFKMMIADAYHHLGLGTQLLKQLLYIAREESIENVDGYVLSENIDMLKICKKLGFEIQSELTALHDPSIIHLVWRQNQVDF